MNLKFLRSALLATCLSAVLAVGAGAAYEGVAVVTGDAVNLRSEPNTACAVTAQATRDEVVLVVEPAGEGWYKVDYCTMEGYMSAEWLEVSDSYDAPLCYGRVTAEGNSLNLRAAPGTDGEKIGSLPHGAVVAVDGMKDGWFKVKYDGKEGYVSATYLLAVSQDNTRKDAAAAADSDLGAQIVAYAKEFLGTPYVYGANGPKSFDCSGFTKYVYGHFGYSMARSAASQLSAGTAVSRENIQVGDLICWKKYGSSKAATHVGIYIGNDQYIHASTSGSVCINDMSYGSNVRGIVGIRRII